MFRRARLVSFDRPMRYARRNFEQVKEMQRSSTPYDEQIVNLIENRKSKRFILSGTREVPIRFKKARNENAKVLAVLFHGAVDKSKRPIPTFQPFFNEISGSAHQISISDPSMLRDGDHTICWYIGDDQFNTQKVVKEIIDGFVSELNIERLIFVGSSGGGFASLYFSWHFPNSIAFTCSPQVDIEEYYFGHRDFYMQNCWPGATLPDLAERGHCTSVLDLYRNSMRNIVVYLVSAGDRLHLVRHASPFIAAVGENSASKFIFLSDYWGVPGHSRSVPLEVYIDWLSILVDYAGSDVTGLLDAYYKLKTTKLAVVSPTALAPKPDSAAPSAKHGVADADAAMATRLRDILLSEEE